jgi:hypothetical protein
MEKEKNRQSTKRQALPTTKNKKGEINLETEIPVKVKKIVGQEIEYKYEKRTFIGNKPMLKKVVAEYLFRHPEACMEMLMAS